MRLLHTLHFASAAEGGVDGSSHVWGPSIRLAKSFELGFALSKVGSLI
jgi:hypothetical protein